MILLFVFCNIHLFKQILFAVSCYSLFPLLFEDQEYPIKVLLLLTYGALMWVGFSSHFAANPAPGGEKLDASDNIVEKKLTGWISLGYLLGMFAIEFWSRLFHHHVYGDRLPFLPLMIVSVYCGIGMMYSWIWQLSWIIRHT
uniref:Alpha-1,3-glucosyltransferase n=1 Tax=Aegilops tauschii subsp. strangulata TaxID=200361 RepID=A0A453PAU6_AEGTS